METMPERWGTTMLYTCSASTRRLFSVLFLVCLFAYRSWLLPVLVVVCLFWF
jgi:hypothetical protein